MKYINIKSSVFTLILASFSSVQAFNLNDYFNNSNESDDVAQEEVVATAQQQTPSYKMQLNYTKLVHPIFFIKMLLD